MTELEQHALAYITAVDTRRLVCRRDCEWPRGDGVCSYCLKEEERFNELYKAVKDKYPR